MTPTEPQRRPLIIDTTLREGAQAPGVRFGVEESIEIARALVGLGVDMVECGHPHASEVEAHRLRGVVAACGSVPVLAHARANTADIDSVRASGAQWVGIFAGINAMSTACRMPDRPVRDVVREAVTHAKQSGLRVRFTVEDASRTDWPDLIEAYRIALDSGADRLCFADTVGLLCPWEVEATIERLCVEFAGVDVEVHFHDDRGMAGANALGAARAGAQWLSSSVNGIGERCGITDTLTLLANLASLGWRADPDGQRIQGISALVRAVTRQEVDSRRPVVGRDAFTHVAKLHRRAVERDAQAYAWTPPERLGRVNSNELTSLPAHARDLINTPDVVSAVELKHHRRGPGERYLMLDERVVSDARQYCIVRDIPRMDDYGPGHVDVHRHHVDSMFLFIGHEADLTGLEVEVRLGNETFEVASPSSVFIPSGMLHGYRVLGGAGLFVNHVLAGEYNASLLEVETRDVPEPAPAAPEVAAGTNGAASAGTNGAASASTNGAAHASLDDALGFVNEFVEDRLPGTRVAPTELMLEVFDSLLLLDFFLHVEGVAGERISLDEVASCETFADAAQLLAVACPKGALAVRAN